MAKFRNIPEDQQNELEEQMKAEEEFYSSEKISEENIEETPKVMDSLDIARMLLGCDADDDQLPPKFFSEEVGYDEFLIDHKQEILFPVF